jgi:Tol biopolymer transport system component
MIFVGNYAAIYAMNLDGSGLINLSQPPAGDTDSDPHWSPDGSRIVFRRHHPGPPSSDAIWIVQRMAPPRPSSPAARPTTRRGVLSREPSWRP